MAIVKKVMWIVGMNSDADEQAFAQHVNAAGIDTVCIRTTTSRLPDAVGRFHKLGKKVWAWRWPGVDPDPAKAKGPHYYAPLEADFVAKKLIPAGLDGYIVDPESDTAGDVNDWNDKKHKPLAINSVRRSPLRPRRGSCSGPHPAAHIHPQAESPTFLGASSSHRAQRSIRSVIGE